MNLRDEKIIAEVRVLLPFAACVLGGDLFQAETFVLSLMKKYPEYMPDRKNLLSMLWQKIKPLHAIPVVKNGFYQLATIERAVLFLRIRQHFSNKDVAQILSLPEEKVNTVFEQSARQLLGKAILSWEL